MTNQLPLYRNAVPVSPQQHLNTSVKAGGDYSFARQLNSVLLMAVEFEFSAGEYAIVFAGEPGPVMPVALLGVRDQENLYVGPSGEWLGKYIPAFLRRYPFIFASGDAGNSFTLCVDASYSGVNQDGRGERLFDSQGERTQYLQNVLNFLQAEQTQFQATRTFVQSLEDLQLFDPMEAQFTLSSGQTMKIAGFKVINRERLRKMEGEKLAEFARSGGLDLIYAHLHSLRNLAQMVERIGQSAPSEALSDRSASEALEPASV